MLLTLLLKLLIKSATRKARNSLDYYKSGLASAQSELRKITESSNAYVGRLEAEGKHEEANKAKLSGLSREYDKLNQVIRSNLMNYLRLPLRLVNLVKHIDVRKYV